MPAVFRRIVTPYAGTRLRVNWSHPLAQGLVAAWVGNPAGAALGAGNSVDAVTMEVIFNQDSLRQLKGATPAVYRDTPAGPGLGGMMGHNTSGAGASARLRITGTPSIFWLGIITGAISGSGAGYLAGTSYDNANSSPFDCYGIIRPSGNSTSVNFDYNDGTTAQGVTVASQISTSDYGARPIAFSASFGRSTVHAYKNGVQIGSAARLGTAIAYSSKPGFSINGTYRADISTANSASVTVIAMVWNRELTATDHMLLARNPFVVFASRPLPISPVVSGGGGGVSVESYARVLRGTLRGIGRGVR